MVHQAPIDNFNSAPFSNVWYPDTGANAHATPQLDGLRDVETYTRDESLRVGDGTGLLISKTGFFLFPLRYGHCLYKIFCMFLNYEPLFYLCTNLLLIMIDVYFEFHPSSFVVKDRRTSRVLLRGSSSGGNVSASSVVACCVPVCSCISSDMSQPSRVSSPLCHSSSTCCLPS